MPPRNLTGRTVDLRGPGTRQCEYAGAHMADSELSDGGDECMRSRVQEADVGEKSSIYARRRRRGECAANQAKAAGAFSYWTDQFGVGTPFGQVGTEYGVLIAPQELNTATRWGKQDDKTPRPTSRLE